MLNILPLYLFNFGYYSEGEWVDVSVGHIIFTILLTIITAIVVFLLLYRHKTTNQPQPALGCLSFILVPASFAFLGSIFRALWESASVFVLIAIICLAITGFTIYKIANKTMNTPKRYARLLVDDASKRCELLTHQLISHNKTQPGTFFETSKNHLPYIICFYEYLIYLRQSWLYQDAKSEIQAAFSSYYPHGLREKSFAYLDTFNVTHTGFMHEVWGMFYAYAVEFGIIPNDVPDDPETFKFEYNDLIEMRSSINEIFNEKECRKHNPFKKK